MGSVAGERRRVNVSKLMKEAMAEAQAKAKAELERRMGEKLEGEVDRLLGRGAYERRAEVGSWVEVEGQCQRCKSRQSRRFSRNGGRDRSLESQWGVLAVRQQRLVCECGGRVWGECAVGD